jgi:hypothetical protein
MNRKFLFINYQFLYFILIISFENFEKLLNNICFQKYLL